MFYSHRNLSTGLLCKLIDWFLYGCKYWLIEGQGLSKKIKFCCFKFVIYICQTLHTIHKSLLISKFLKTFTYEKKTSSINWIEATHLDGSFISKRKVATLPHNFTQMDSLKLNSQVKQGELKSTYIALKSGIIWFFNEYFLSPSCSSPEKLYPYLSYLYPNFPETSPSRTIFSVLSKNMHPRILILCNCHMYFKYKI